MAISFSELLVVLGAGVALLGTKDVSNGMRAAGVLVGRAAGFLFQARSVAYKYAQEAQLVELHKEVTHGVQQLDSVRRDLSGGLRFFSNPLTFASSSLRDVPAAGPQRSAEQSGSLGSGAATAARTTSSATASESSPTSSGSSGPGPTMAAPQQQQQRVRVAPMPQRQPAFTPSPENEAALTSSGDLPMIPVSAVSAGRAPRWDGKVPTGSDILLDALMEQKVAMHAKAFMDSREVPRRGGPAAATQSDAHQTQGGEASGQTPPAQRQQQQQQPARGPPDALA